MSVVSEEEKSTKRWPKHGAHEIPYVIYRDPETYGRELDRFFYSGHWCYVGLEAEIPNTGDFKRNRIGERSVIMTRAKDGHIHVFENACAHRGVQFCRKRYGNCREFVCPYHQWSYDLEGNLRGIPYRRGVRKDGQFTGGMPSDFKPEQHNLTKLKVATRGGVVFASFDSEVEPLEEFLGPQILSYFDRIFDGRKLRILGYNRQRIPSNWKLMQENIKDPYHPGLLHTWFVTFGLWRADSEMRLRMDERKRHAVMASVRAEGKPSDDTASKVSSYREDMTLNDQRQLDIVPEDWWNGLTVTMLTLYPSLIIQQQVNSLSTRHIQPRGPGDFDFVWTHFGFEDDSEEMTERRLTQANLFGPAGYVSADDGEVIEFSQMSFNHTPSKRCLVEMGGREAEDAGTGATETLIRGMYQYWRSVMGE